MIDIFTDEQRDAYWKSRKSAKARCSRVAIGGWNWLWYRLSRWWGLKPTVGLAQIGALGSYLLLLAATIYAVVRTVRRSPTDPPATTGDWLKVLGFAASTLILWYKNRSRKVGGEHELERRQAIEALVQHLDANDRIRHVEAADEARLKELCECVRLDVEDFLQVQRGEVDLLLLDWSDDPSASGGRGWLTPVARDRGVPAGFFAKRRPAMETFIFESIRAEPRATVFHDTKSRQFVAAFGKLERSGYRCVFCLPIVGGTNLDVARGILTIKLKRPYVLWPFRSEEFDRRLRMYAELIALFMPRKQP